MHEVKKILQYNNMVNARIIQIIMKQGQHVHTCTCIHTDMNTHMCTCKDALIHTSMHAPMHALTHSHTLTHSLARSLARSHARTHAHTHTHTHHTHTHSHTPIHTDIHRYTLIQTHWLLSQSSLHFC